MTTTASSLNEAIEIAKGGGDCMVRCPSHPDKQASLHVKHGDKHPVVMTCHAGCTPEQILEAAGIAVKEIMGEDQTFDRQPTRCLILGAGPDTVADDAWTPVRDPNGGPNLQASAIYRYVDEDGTHLFDVCRVPLPDGGKSFRQRRPKPDASRGWVWNTEGVKRVLYRLPEVIQAINEGRTIWLVEGEKDAETLITLGEVATTCPMGAGNGKWQESYTATLAGATVTIVADADDIGRNHARIVREQLEGAGCSVRVVESTLGKDITDHILAGGTLDSLVETTPEQQAGKTNFGIDVLEAIKRPFKENRFVIPGVIARGDRFLLTGYEGHGKSTFCKQWAIQCAAGIHPWTLAEMPPQKVLYLDAENSPEQSQEDWAHLLGLARAHGREVQPGQLILLEEWDGDIDLTTPEGEAYINERMHAFRPDLLIIGPLYNLSERDLSDHQTVNRLKRVVNNARALYGSAVLMEHHAPHRQPGDTTRSVRPYGSSTFLKWPEFGYGLKPMTNPDDPQMDEKLHGVYELKETRKNRVRKRYFPSHLRWGKEDSIEWPWMEAMVDNEGNVY